ncbi:hypothetical protein [Halococcoides cellulosivorans]|uniref:Ribbon-helix-helix protein CopG domain-containing protein n=1 Tax=Halococcoides cellulosivorans TaxID=1679096 RepID=A0A2R4X2G5_9EURY|nr:hypothetical protein [Halococcoides cellulosivorans]AWB27988.1 hypothetical protein HARCEL1_09845 [Halococcoides cellulosivorans]
MTEGRTRVDFNAPTSLVDRADGAAELLDVSRTQLLVEALEDRLADLAGDEQFRHRLAEAYYDGRVDYDTVEDILGTEEAMGLQVLRASLDRDPPVPRLDEVPTDEEFYDGPVPEWAPDDER